MKAALYLRVSTEEQAREGLSLAVQEQQCRDRARQALPSQGRHLGQGSQAATA